MGTKARRKPYSKAKQITRVADHLTRNVYLVSTPRIDGYCIYHTKGCLLKPDKLMMSSLSKPFHWGVLVAALGVDHAGKKYMMTDGFKAKSRYYVKDLNPLAEDYMDKVVARINDNQFVGEAWIAAPSGKQVSEEEAMDIFEKMLAWTPLTVEEQIAQLMHKETEYEHTARRA